MAFINVIDETQAEGKLKQVYEDIIEKRGKLSNIMRIHSLNPASMEKHMDLYLSVMFNKSGLSREERELIAVIVSAANNCEYCINHHAEALNFYWKDDEKVQKVIDDYKSINLIDRLFTVLDYASKLTKNPNEITEADIKKMKGAGYSDENILNINLIVSYFNFVNRIVLGLGVEFNEEEVSGYKY